MVTARRWAFSRGVWGNDGSLLSYGSGFARTTLGLNYLPKGAEPNLLERQVEKSMYSRYREGKS